MAGRCRPRELQKTPMLEAVNWYMFSLWCRVAIRVPAVVPAGGAADCMVDSLLQSFPKV